MRTAPRHLTGWLLGAVGLIAAACDGGTVPPTTTAPGVEVEVRVHQLQVLATHNSYHLEAPTALLDAIRGIDPQLADSISYSHPTLTEQLDLGVRGLELDVFADPDGGRYATPKAVDRLGLEPLGADMQEPGFKVLHMQELDYGTTCATFVRCLDEVADWSSSHPEHVPIVIQLEARDGIVLDPLGLGFVQPLPIDGPGLTALEAEIRSVFDDDQLLLPGEVDAAGTWPAVDDARGRIVFALDDHGAKRALYRELHPQVADRVLFVDATAADPDAAFAVVNDPVRDASRIRQLVRDGILVRTRADADTVEARTSNTARPAAAFASGAQVVSTDYEVEDPRYPGFSVALPGGAPARCNPVNAPAGCKPSHVSE